MYKYFNINDDYYRVPYGRHPQTFNRLAYRIINYNNIIKLHNILHNNTLTIHYT